MFENRLSFNYWRLLKIVELATELPHHALTDPAIRNLETRRAGGLVYRRDIRRRKAKHAESSRAPRLQRSALPIPWRDPGNLEN